MKDTTRYGIAGLVLGIALTWAVAAIAVNNRYDGMMRVMGMRTDRNGSMMGGPSGAYTGDMPMQEAMNDMMMGIYNKSGDSFDEAFLDEMIIHHEGAIRMSEAALRSAKHQEVIDLASRIIAAQIKEIDQMESWRKAWFR